MALSIFKSTDELPWDRFSNRLARILRSEGGSFARTHHRTLALGSPVKITEAGSDLIRVPIEVRGGPREYAIAYLHVRHIEDRPDERRLLSIVEAALHAADAHPASPPADPGALVLTYP